MSVETEKKELWFRLCPSCGKQIIFESQLSCELSINLSPVCSDCRSPVKPGQNRTKQVKKRKRRNKVEVVSDNTEDFLAKQGDAWLRKCPNENCQKLIRHQGKNAEAATRNAIKQHRQCRKCSGKIKVKENNPDFTFQGREHKPETKETCAIRKRIWWIEKTTPEDQKSYFEPGFLNGSGSCQCKPLPPGEGA